ncbi:MAG: 4-hydroxy-3-methylbut-2-enyl diphosphate reductase [Cryomorphaceae bacterium]|nr:MAG: 4-hydroxy-3-methylbut-2-enyl diphosphate reductase [Cryomorphaceae bacterium]
MKKFEIPTIYRSEVIGKIKEARKIRDPRKKDFEPTLLDFGPVRFYIARHFGFCYGVENAIEISYKALDENPDRRIFLLSQMIHNPEVNNDLLSRGIRFIMDTEGNQIIDWSELKADDIVIIPAFGTTIEIENKLAAIGIETQSYNTTCPFVEKVWNRSRKLGQDHYTVIIHGKRKHEETRATFSHSKTTAPSLVIRDMEEAKLVAAKMRGEISTEEFFKHFSACVSEGFDPDVHLQRVGVVNQTTMLATETQAIADFFKDVAIEVFGAETIQDHFADTRDTLCYATNDNQQATYGLLEKDADLAIVVGGYNSSNTSHLVELCAEKFPTYFINSESEIESGHAINHFNYLEKIKLRTENYLPDHRPVTIILTSGASCPDAVVDRVLHKVLSYFEDTREIDSVVEEALMQPE